MLTYVRCEQVKLETRCKHGVEVERKLEEEYAALPNVNEEGERAIRKALKEVSKEKGARDSVGEKAVGGATHRVAGAQERVVMQT